MIKAKPSKSFILKDLDNDTYLSDMKNLSFGNEPIALTYVKAERLANLIQNKSGFKRRLEVQLLKK